MNADAHLKLMIGDSVFGLATIAAERDELRERIARAVQLLVRGDNMLPATQEALAALVGGTAAQDMAAPGIVNTIAGDGAIPLVTGVYLLTKGSAAAITLANPVAANAGVRITVTCGSNFAHVVTSASANIGDGTTGGLKTAWTAAAFIGSSITLVCIGASGWVIESKNLGAVA